MISLGTTYDMHDPILLGGILPYVEYLEVTPDSIAGKGSSGRMLNEDVIRDLVQASSTKKIIAHGVGLSLGTYHGMNEGYFDLLDQLVHDVSLSWHSEHLGYTTVDGTQLNTMLAMPRTLEVLYMLIERVQVIQKRYQIPFLLENIVHMIPDCYSDYSDAEFLNILAGETGCGLILDVYNLECDHINHGFDIKAFLGELDLSNVIEIHIAGGRQMDGFQMDVHSRPVAQSTIDLTMEVLNASQNVRALTYEIMSEAVMTYGSDMVIEEVQRLNHIFCA